MNYKDAKNAFPDYKWKKTTIKQCKKCYCKYNGNNSWCSIWEVQPKECSGYGVVK